MPILRNPKHEIFCQQVVKGLKHSEAAKAAGYSAHSASCVGSRMASLAKVKERIRELAEQGAAASVAAAALNRAWVLETLQENVERAMQRKPVLDKDGKETGEYTYQGAVANRALELLGQELGMFKQRIEHTGEGVHFSFEGPVPTWIPPAENQDSEPDKPAVTPEDPDKPTTLQ